MGRGRNARARVRGSKRTRANLKWGVSHGLGIAALYAGLGVVRLLLRGISPFGAAGRVVLAATGMLGAVGLLSGAIVGLLRPHTANPFGSLLVGFIAAGPIVFGVMLLVEGLPKTWPESALPVLLLIWPFVAAILGRELYRAAKNASTE